MNLCRRSKKVADCVWMIFFVVYNMWKTAEAIPLWGWNSTKSFILDRFPSPHQVNYISNSCGAGYRDFGESNVGNDLWAFACPHMMMFSEDMMLAAKYDKLDEDFLYVTAGSRSDDDCGKCFHILVEDEEESHHRPIKHLIVQVINSGGDVGYRQLDLFVGAGGLGYYTACNTDCTSQYCGGGACQTPMYTGTFSDWTNSEFQGNGNACYNGGVKWFPPFDINMLETLCSNLFKNDDPTLFKNQQLYKSCVESNKYFFHQNFGKYRATRVRCPEGLYMLTGLRRSDDDIFPSPSLENELNEECRGSTCITTMCDCCKPSCSWPYKGQPSNDWSSVRSCDKYGFPFQ